MLDAQRILGRRVHLLLLLAVISPIVFSPLLRSSFLMANDFSLVGRESFAGILNNLGWFDLSPRALDLSILVRLISHVLYRLFGLDGWKYAVLCITLQWLNCCLIYELTFRLSSSAIAAGCAAAFFAVEPAHVVVVWHLFATLSQMLATSMSLLTLLLFLGFSEDRRPMLYVAALCTFTAGLMCSEVTLTTLLIVPLWACLAPARSKIPQWRWWAGYGAPFVVIGGLYTVLGAFAYFGRWSEPSYSPEGYLFGWHIFRNAITYLGSLLSPTGGEWSAFRLLVLAFIIVLVVDGWRFVEQRVRLLTALSMGISLVPFLFFKERVVFSSDCRYVYMASVYFCIMIGLSAWKGKRMTVTLVCGTLLLAGWSFKTYTMAARQRMLLDRKDLALERVAAEFCGRPADATKEAVLRVWPDAHVYWMVERERMPNYLRARCGLPLTLK
jgi:hypothetical protein